MDLLTLDTKDASNQGAVMELENPATGEKLLTESGEPITITLLGIDSDKLKKRQNELTNEVLKKGFRPKMTTAEKQETDRLTTLALATVSWSNIEMGGKKLDCTTDNARSLYKALPWLKEQADAFIADRANFLKAPSTASSKT
ncbi:MAG TPA: hypothetical protein VIL30_18075 [Ramlibacter sp.]|jgi:hypothetical protein